jgi:hypothetical protein
MVRSPRSGRLEPSGTTVAFILRDAATRLLRMRFDTDMRPRSRGMICPRLDPESPPGRGSRECRMHAAPAVSCAMGRWKRTRAYRFSGGNPAFPAQWLYGLLRALPGDEFLFVTVTSGLRFVLSPVGPTRLRWLDISHGCQNHTTSPYAAPSLHSDRRDAGPKFWQRP